MKLLIPTSVLLFTLVTSSTAEPKQVDRDLALFQAQLKQMKFDYDRWSRLGREGAVGRDSIDQKEAQYKLFSDQVKNYQRLPESAKPAYARLLKIQNAQICKPPETSGQPTPPPKVEPGPTQLLPK